MILFIHIAKTGGTNLRVQLEKGEMGKCLLDYDGFLNTQPSLGTEQLLSNDVIFGHFQIKKYAFLKQHTDLKKICLFRDPVERTISHYYFWKYAINDRKNPMAGLVQDGHVSLAEFAWMPTIRNIYRMVLDNGKVQDFDFIGITERFDKSLTRINEMFGCNFTPSFLNNQDLTPYAAEIEASRAELIKANEENYHYYHEAIKHFWL